MGNRAAQERPKLLWALFTLSSFSGLLLILHMAFLRSDATRSNAERTAPAQPDAAPADKCYTAPHTEYEGSVEMWGEANILPSPAACCESCRAHRAREEAAGHAGRGCVLWVFCGAPGGCGGQPGGACWGKRYDRERDGLAPRVRARGPAVPWTSGAAFTEAEGAAVLAAERAASEAVVARRERAGNPRVFFEVAIDGAPSGRIEFVLYAREAPRHAENFRAMCTAELGGRKSFAAMRFYRIIDAFIDQAGVDGVESIWDEPFDDDPGGLALRHERGGLLSSANSGPDTNTGHFSIVVAPAPHLDGSYTVFGEVASGMETVAAINRLAARGGGGRAAGTAVVTRAGCLCNCEPRPDVTPKCRTRGPAARTVQGRQVQRACLD